MKYKVLFNAISTKSGPVLQGEAVDEAELHDAKGLLEAGAIEAVESSKKKTKAEIDAEEKAAKAAAEAAAKAAANNQ